MIDDDSASRIAASSAARERFDERDNVQSRGTLTPGTPEYDELYGLHPEWKRKDDAIRALPGMGRAPEAEIEGTGEFDGFGDHVGVIRAGITERQAASKCVQWSAFRFVALSRQNTATVIRCVQLEILEIGRGGCARSGQNSALCRHL